MPDLTDPLVAILVAAGFAAFCLVVTIWAGRVASRILGEMRELLEEFDRRLTDD